MSDEIIRAALHEAGMSEDEMLGRRREDTVVIAVIKIVQKMFDDHVGHEMERYASIDMRIEETRTLIAENRAESNGQHEQTQRLVIALQQSINAYMGGQDEFARAFLKKPDGSLDLDGHHDDHKKRVTAAQWWADKRDKVLTKVLEWAGVIVVAWLLQAVFTQAISAIPFPGK